MVKERFPGIDMDGRTAVADKAETFLRGLTPRAREMLMRRLENAQPVPAEVEARRRLIQEAARVIAENRAATEEARPVSVEDMRSLVFSAFDPYVVDERPAIAERGFISAATLSQLWTYASTELLPDAFSPWADPETAPQLPNLRARQEEAARLELKLFAALARRMAEIKEAPKAEQRFMSRIGGEVAYQEVQAMLAIRERLDDLPTLSAAIVHLLGTGPVDLQLLEQIATYLTKFPEAAGWVASGVHRRLGAVAPLIAFAKMLAGGDTARRVRSTPAAAAFVDIALAAADTAASRFLAVGRRSRNPAEAIAQINAVRTVLTDVSNALDIDNDASWRQRTVAIRRRFSDTLFAEFDKLLPTLRRAFRVQDAPFPGTADGAEAIYLAAIFSAASRSRDALAVNGLIGRLSPLVDQAIELYARDLPTKLRKLGGDGQAAALSAMDALIKVAGHLYGDDYAAHLRRIKQQQLRESRSAA